VPQKHKTAALPRQGQSKAKPAAAQPKWFLTVLVIASIAVVIVGILLLKDQRQSAVALSGAQASGSSAVSSAPSGASAANQLNQALAQGKPALVFIHSTSCQSCKDMMKVVDQVYPEFAGQVTLVDVDVYNEANGPLMQKLGLRYIPTVVVFNREGQSWQNVGLMKPDAFRTFLRQRALGG